MFLQILGDPSGMCIKLFFCWLVIFRGTYHQIMRPYRVKAQLKKQCPPVRLNINGEFRGKSEWQRPPSRILNRAVA